MLQNYIEGLGQDLDFPNNGGKLSEVGEQQQQRKITEQKTKVELQSVIFKDHTMTYSEKFRRSYNDLPEADQQKFLLLPVIIYN